MRNASKMSKVMHKTGLQTGGCYALRRCRRYVAALIAAVVLLSIVPVTASAQDFQAQEPLRELISAYLDERVQDHGNRDIEIKVGRLDSRLRLTACSTPPTAFLPSGTRLSGKLTVGIRCQGTKPWTLYIPAEIKIYTDVVVAASHLSRGTAISMKDVINVRQEVSYLNAGYFTDPNELVGKVLKHDIREGTAISPRKVKAPLLVKQGEEVTIIASLGNLEVRSKGKALKNAARGETLQVRNTRSKRVIEAIAIRPGTVSIKM